MKMKYKQGRLGRVFVAKVDHGDNLLKELKQLADKEKIEAGILYVIGALKEASMVVGPAEFATPPVPVWRSFSDCREIIGIGTLFSSDGEPEIHLHGAVGREDTSLIGCIRGDSQVYLVCEVMILEVTGTGAIKQSDLDSGLKMLAFYS